MDGVLAVGLGEFDLDIFDERGGDIFADEIRLDGEFAVAAINQHGKLDAAGAAEIVESIHRRADGAATEENVVHENDGLAGDIEGNGGGVDVGSDAMLEVVAVQVDIKAAIGDGMFPDFGEERAEALREMDAAALDADEDDFGTVVIAFGDLVGDAGEGALQCGSVEDEGGIRHKKSDPAFCRIARG
jgi:hypothetical protein